MEELADGRWKPDTAFEADIVGRAAGIGDGEDNSRHFLKHGFCAEVTYDEVVFLERESDPSKYGEIITTKHTAAAAEQGLLSIVEANATLEGVAPEVATVFLRAIRTSREARTIPLHSPGRPRLMPAPLPRPETQPIDKTAA